jgi:hypothetical protein
VLLTALVGVIGLLGYDAYERWKNRPVKIMCHLECLWNEVRYVKGPAENFVYDDGSEVGLSRVIHKSELQKKEFKGKKDTDFYEWSWGEESKRIDITFEKEAKSVQAISCYDESRLGHCNINFIKRGHKEEDVYNVLGTEVEKFLEEGGVTKLLSYKQYNMKIYLSKTSVYMIKVEQIKDAHRMLEL